MVALVDIVARQILDSRGNPTVEVDVYGDNGVMARASVPSGASTGKHEAVERRDNNKASYLGKSVTDVVKTIHGEIAQTLMGRDVFAQRSIDQTLCDLDGTPNKSRLGANATLGISLAVAKLAAYSLNMPLYQYIGGSFAETLPIPLLNILNGGAHADNGVDIQEFMIVPHGFDSFSKMLEASVVIYHTLKTLLKEKGLSTGIGDEGGFAPSLNRSQDALDLIMTAIEKAGFKPGQEVALALDVAATELFEKGSYHFKGLGKTFTSAQLVDYYKDLAANYPLISIEDGMSEDDWEGWIALTEALGERVQLVGDDLFVTNVERLTKGINEKAANAILIKPNQIGTLTETVETVRKAHAHGFKSILSHRSGETDETVIADLAVALGSSQIKTGAPCRGERVAKYNQLLRIEEQLRYR